MLFREWYDEKANDWRFRIHFDYDDRLMRELSISDLLAVECYSGEGEEKHFGVLSIVRKEAHDLQLYTMLKDLDTVGQDVAKSLFKKVRGDFRRMISGKRDDDKSIIVYAKRTPLGLEGDEKRGYVSVPSSQQLRQGADVYILEAKILEKIYNAGMEKEPYLEPGHLLGQRRNVRVKLSSEKMVTTHSGVFGYTGTGKSNMVSCLADGLLSSLEDVNVVIFDLEEEYAGLLVDQLDDNENSMICFSDIYSIPKKMRLYMEGTASAVDAVDEFVGQMLLPKDLSREKEHYKRVFKKILEDGKFKFYAGKFNIQTIADFDKKILGRFVNIPGIGVEKSSNECELIEKQKKEHWGGKYDLENLTKLRETVGGWEGGTKSFTNKMVRHNLGLIDEHLEFLSFRAKEEFLIRRDELVDLLMEKNSRKLILFQGENEWKLQQLSKEIISDQKKGIYYRRKHAGQIRPLTMFIFDEADKFISSRKVEQSDIDSREAVETIVRRGRKIGLGALIATQRMSLLDTNVISQLHTYFISKLPRKDDQQKVVEGFGMGLDMLRETFKFNPGDWLIISNDATGLRNSPINMHSDNTNERIKEFFRKGQVSSEQEDEETYPKSGLASDLDRGRLLRRL